MNSCSVSLCELMSQEVEIECLGAGTCEGVPSGARLPSSRC